MDSKILFNPKLKIMKTLSLQQMENVQGGNFWDCMRETGGKKIGRGMVGGALLGLRGGIKGMAIGAVGGALFGAFWAAADCTY